MSSELLPSQLPPSPHPDLDIEAQLSPHHCAEETRPEPHPKSPAPIKHPLQPNPLHPPYCPHPEWLSLIMSFCFAGISIAFQSLQASKHPPWSFHMACLGVVLALAAFVVSKYIPARLRREAQLLENAGVFLGITAFCLEITLLFPLCLKVITWVIYVAALLAIILSRYFNVYLLPPKVE